MIYITKQGANNKSVGKAIKGTKNQPTKIVKKCKAKMLDTTKILNVEIVGHF